MKKNKIICCKVVGIQDYGMFVNCGEYEGLVHISEISDQFVRSIDQIFQVGDIVDLMILEVDEDEKRLKLSYKKNHHINSKIIKNIPIKIGFQSLNRELPKWVLCKKKENGYEDNNE
ncbi:MAG: S1 RNA-binding domain-containing protein [Acholeplasma sp.]|nr:S1 RNA-binding domain-containing protein [Acholeplasma sp.]